MSPTIAKFDPLMRKKNFSGVFNLIKSLKKSDIPEACKFITAYFNRNNSINADEFWHFAAVISSANWWIIRDTIVVSRIQRNLISPSVSNRRYFKEVLKAFADNDDDIKDIHDILTKYRKFIDRGCLSILSHRTKDFLWPDGYSILCDGAELTFSEYKQILLKDRTICSLYEYARTLISATFGYENGKPKTLPISRILKHANDLGDTPAERMCKDALMVYCNHDMESEACDLLCNDDFKGYKAYFNANYRKKKEKKTLKESNNPASTDIENRQSISAAEHKTDFNTVEVKGIPLKLVAYKEGRMAFTEPIADYKGGILFPQNVTLRKQPLPYDIACRQIQVIFQSGQKTGFNIIDTTNYQNECYAIVTLDFEQLLDKKNMDLFNGLQVGGTYPVEIKSSGQHFKKVGILLTNFYGYISNEDYKKSMAGDDENMVIPIAALPQNECQPILFGSDLQHHIKIDREAERQLRDRYENLFNNLELQYMKSEDRRLVDLMLSEYPSFGSDAKRLDVIEEQDIFCRFEDSSLDAEEKMHDLQTILDNNNFWVYPRNYNGSDYLTIYNQKSIVIEIEVRGFDFYLKGLFDATADATAQKKLEYAKNTNLKIRGNKIRLHSIYDTIPSDYNATWIFTYIQRLSYYFKIKNDLSNRVYASLENTARDFKNQQLYLDYQIDKELKKRKSPLHFSPERLRPVSGDWQDEAISLMIDMSASEYLYLMGYTEDEETLEDEISVNTIVDYKVKDRCRLTINADGEYVLKFLGSHKNCAEYQKDGIDLQSDANVEHLKMQSIAIKEFTRDADSLFRDLIGNNISIPEWHKYDNIEFFNKQFYKVEEGNNQPEAVKKALSLEKKGVLLIQGPPGTGKTTTIVEIIRQLISQKRKVLVCSQSHAAVGNIYDKLVPFCDNILRVDIDEHNTSNARNFNSEDYMKFLANNTTLLSRLREKKDSDTLDDSLYSDFIYSNEIIQKQYKQLHNHIVHYYRDNKELDTPTLTKMLSYLEEEAQNISGSMLETQIYQSKDAILGTCIGVGMNYILKNNTVHFDTVIIDEAAKANLAETIVPLRMGDRYILVGDDNQLPPYVDQGEIEELIKSSRYNTDNKLSYNEMVNSQNKSLFEYLHYHRDPLFPEDCLVTLNYQYRMNPEIGDFISNLFYGGKIMNGEGTDRQDVFVPGFPNPVTIIDTSGQKDNHESSVSGSTSHRNVCEAKYICEEIVPKLGTVMMNNNGITVGIISPYASQCEYIRSLIGDQKLRNAVHTIDSIQGMEFDIVVFSFVRSFSPGSKAKVGFVDDMKRLNVSLSRAKKKLIVIGDMQTLTNPTAHYEVETEGVKPLDVFCKLASLPTKISISKTSIEHFLSSGIEIGEVLQQCSWNYGRTNSTILVSFEYKERLYHFQMKVSSAFKVENKTSDKIDLKYLGLGRDSKPYFGFASLDKETRYGYFNLLAKCVDAKDFPTVKFEFEGEQFEVEMSNLRSLRLSMQKGFMYYIKRERYDYVDVDLDKQISLFKSNYKLGDLVEGVITGSKDMLRYTPPKTLYYVNVDGCPCGCITRSELEEGSVHTFSLYQYDDENNRITLSYNYRYDR